MPQHMIPGGPGRDPHSPAVSGLQGRAMTAWFSSQLLFLQCQQCPGALCITSRHSPATPRDRCNKDGHTAGWEAQKGNTLAPTGHTASNRSWTPVPHTYVTILCYHWSSLGPSLWSAPLSGRSQVPQGSLHSLCGPRPLPPSCYQSQRGPSRPSPPTSTSLSYTGHRSQPGTGVSGRFHKTALSSSQCRRRGTRKGCGWGSSRPHSCDQESLTSCIQWQPCYSDVFVGVFLAEPFFFFQNKCEL